MSSLSVLHLFFRTISKKEIKQMTAYTRFKEYCFIVLNKDCLYMQGDSGLNFQSYINQVIVIKNVSLTWASMKNLRVTSVAL